MLLFRHLDPRWPPSPLDRAAFAVLAGQPGSGYFLMISTCTFGLSSMSAENFAVSLMKPRS